MKNKFSFSTNSAPMQVSIKAGKPQYYKLKPIFSFEYYICSDRYFSREHSNERRNSLYNFLQNIKNFSAITWGEMKENPKVYHFHEFIENVSVLNSYTDRDMVQFKIPGQKQGRFIGFFDNNNVFNVLLYDSQHQADPRK